MSSLSYFKGGVGGGFLFLTQTLLHKPDISEHGMQWSKAFSRAAEIDKHCQTFSKYFTF
jgi:hypothetical protein